MTDSTLQPTSAVENVGRGATFALLSIPISIVAFSILAGFAGFISGIVAIVVPNIAAWLYARGAGAPLSRAGWAPFVGIAAAAVLLGVAAGIVAGAFYGFTAVNGKGGLFGAAFATTLRTQLTTNIGDYLLPIGLGLVLGAFGIVGVLRGKRTAGTGPAVAPQAAGTGPIIATTPTPNTTTAAATAALADAPITEQTHRPAARSAHAAPPAPNQPSPGVILNGKPLDPQK